MSFHHRGRSLTKVAVIGSGQIGPDIALFFTKVLSPFGVQTVVVDVSEDALARGKAKLEKKVGKGVETGAFSPEQQTQMVGHVTFTSDYDQIQGAELVIEAATEDKGLKQKIFGQVEGLVADDAILASNSSHLEPEAIFEQAKHKNRSAVVHYFFPAERNMVVEVVEGKDTDSSVSDWLMSFYEAIGKVPLRVQSRYGYALDPVFEGMFHASALLAEAGIGTTKQIDMVARDAVGVTIGFFTAMNLTGGNPITAVGLDNYTSKINTWYRTPQSLKDKVAAGEHWDVPKRGEEVDVPDDLRETITRKLRGAYFGICCEIIDAGLIDLSDFNLGTELALDAAPAFQFMNELGTAEALKLVQEYAADNPGFPVAKCLQEKGADNTPWEIRNVLRNNTDGVAVLTIRRPKVLNALDQSVFHELATRCQEADADGSVKAIVLTGFGKKAFVSGADVNFLAKIENEDQGVATSRESQGALNKIEDVKKPIVCALNGLAFGGGIELAMSCTTRIALAGLKVLAAQPEVNLGIIPGAGGTQRLPRLVGIEKAAELLRTARPISSEDALAIGLIQETVEGELVPRAIELAAAIADGKAERPAIRREPMENVPEVFADVDIKHRSKRVDEILCEAILGGAKMSLRDAIDFEAQCFGKVCTTKDMRIGVDTFLTKGPRAKAEFVHA